MKIHVPNSLFWIRLLTPGLEECLCLCLSVIARGCLWLPMAVCGCLWMCAFGRLFKAGSPVGVFRCPDLVLQHSPFLLASRASMLNSSGDGAMLSLHSCSCRDKSFKLPGQLPSKHPYKPHPAPNWLQKLSLAHLLILIQLLGSKGQRSEDPV